MADPDSCREVDGGYECGTSHRVGSKVSCRCAGTVPVPGRNIRAVPRGPTIEPSSCQQAERFVHNRRLCFNPGTWPSAAYYSFDNALNRWYILNNRMYSNICFSGRLGDNRHSALPALKDITLGRYVPGESALHRLDPRTKIVGAAILAIGLLGTRSGFTPVGLIACVLLLAQACRLPVRLLLANLRPLLPLLILTLVLNALLTPGRTCYEIPLGAGRFTCEGVERGLFLVGRLSALVLGTSLLTLATSPLELADGLETLLRPFRRIGLPAHELAMTTTIALRFVPILVDEADRLRKAQLARGADFGGGPVRRIRSLFPLLLPLFLSAFGRADRLAVAMEARCYQGDRGRSRYRTYALGAMDGVALAGAVLVSGLALCAGRL